jgi:hypothetical protein
MRKMVFTLAMVVALLVAPIFPVSAASSVWGTVYIDANCNNVIDFLEDPPLGNYPMKLIGVGQFRSGTTDSQGNYWISVAGLPTGNYYLLPGPLFSTNNHAPRYEVYRITDGTTGAGQGSNWLLITGWTPECNPVS